MTNHLCKWAYGIVILLAMPVGVAAGQTPLGSAGFVPTAERPIGWRGDGTGLYPGATPPTVWERATTNPLRDLKCQTQKPADGQGAAGTPLEYANGISYPTEMLVMGPWHNDNAKDTPCLPEEANLAPSAGDTADGKTWTKVSGQFAYLRDLFPKPKDNGKDKVPDNNVAYVMTYIYSPEARSVFVRNTGQVDLQRSYWNGKVFNMGGTVEIQKGWNRLLCKTQARWDGWAIAFGFYEKSAKTYTQKNITWSVPMPAFSNATPVIVGEKLFTTSEPNDLLCVDKNSGKVLWMVSTPLYYAAVADAKASLKDVLTNLKPAAEQLEAMTAAYVKDPGGAKNDERMQLQKKLTESITKADGSYKVQFGWGGGASGPTPITDGKSLFVWYGEIGVLTSFDLDGKRQWCKFFGGNGDEHGINGSPALIGNVIIIFGGHVTYGIDKKTGEMLWKNPSPTRCYASPLTTTIQNIPVAIDPDGSVYKASDGTIISPVLKKPDWDGECASPVLDGQGNFYLVSRNGFGKAKLPATADGTAKVTMAYAKTPKEVSTTELYIVNSPVVFDGICYFAYGGSGFGKKEAFLFAIDTQTGKTLYQQPLPIHPEAFYGPTGGGICASMTIAGGKYLYVLDNAGNCAVVAPGREFKLLASNTIANLQNGTDQESFQASPVFEGNRLYLRGFRNLYCIRADANGIHGE